MRPPLRSPPRPPQRRAIGEGQNTPPSPTERSHFPGPRGIDSAGAGQAAAAAEPRRKQTQCRASCAGPAGLGQTVDEWMAVPDESEPSRRPIICAVMARAWGCGEAARSGAGGFGARGLACHWQRETLACYSALPMRFWNRASQRVGILRRGARQGRRAWPAARPRGRRNSATVAGAPTQSFHRASTSPVVALILGESESRARDSAQECGDVITDKI